MVLRTMKVGGVKGDFFMIKAGLSHIDRDRVVVCFFKRDKACGDFRLQWIARGQFLFVHKTYEASGPISAMFHFAAVGIEYAVFEIG
ncbi:hypothetical protein R0J90_13470, partial [Micrococcus sp. SIMBA_144]